MSGEFSVIGLEKGILNKNAVIYHLFLKCVLQFTD